MIERHNIRKLYNEKLLHICTNKYIYAHIRVSICLWDVLTKISINYFASENFKWDFLFGRM